MQKDASRLLPEQTKGKRTREAIPNRGGTLSLDRRSTHSKDGVDRTLIRWMLSLSPAERLEVLQQNVWAILRLRREETKLPRHTSNASQKTS